MSFEIALDSSLAAALGDDAALVAELRTAFLESAQRHRQALTEAPTDADWRDAALRLKGLAASFGATDLMMHAARAAEAGRRDPHRLADIERALAVLAV